MKKRKDGQYRVQVTLTENGKRIRKGFYGKTPAEVNKKMAAYRGTVERGELFSVVADKWWALHEPTIAYNTRKGYKPAYERAVKEFGSTHIRDLTAKDISQFLVRFSKRFHGQKTARTQLMIFNLLFKYAVVEGYAEKNPATDVSIPKHLSKEKRDLPPKQDVEAIKNGLDAHFGLFAYFLLYTGLRRGEALALQFKDIDRENRLIRITKSVYHDNNQPHIKLPKTEAGKRTVALIGKLESVLPNGKPNDYLFPNKNGGILTETQFQREWELYCIETGITCTPHQLRHAYATRLWELGLDVKDAQELLGHANISTTQDIYTHVSQARKEQVAARLEAL